MPSLDRDHWSVLSPLLDRAFELEPGELARWLEAMRVEQPSLADELERLLADRDAMRRDRFLESESPGEPIRTVGPYRLIRVLGEGGMGTVHLAEQTGKIRRLVALKVIRPGLDSARLLARFAVETQVLAQLDHPGISRIHEAGAMPDGRPYVVMEYVDGPSLVRFCDEKRLPVPERLALFLQVCAAIQHAHQKGVLHRDIKPSNLLVSHVDGRPLVKVIDFGIAKALQPTPDDPLLTQTGATLGTPEYMSPEQAGLEVHDVDTRSDVYALGVVLYELLVGVRPFEAGDVTRPGPLALLEAVRDREPPKPTARLREGIADPEEVAGRRGTDVRHLERQLSGELEWITLRALEKQPERRYASPAELAADVQRYLDGDPVLAGPPSTLYRLRKLARRHRMAAAGLAVVSVTVLAGGVISSVSLVRARQAERLGRERLRQSLLGQAHVLTGSTELDRRARALAVLKEAAAISPGLDARDAAIAALAAPGFRVARQWRPLGTGVISGWTDATLERYARGNADGSVSIHAAADDGELLRLPAATAPAAFGAFSPDGRRLATVTRERELRVWDLPARTGRILLRQVVAYQFTPDSCRLLALTRTHVHVFDLFTGRELRVERAMASPPAALAMHPTEPLLVTAEWGSRELEIRSTETGALLRKLPVPPMGLHALWTGDGRALVTAHADYSVQVWTWPAMDVVPRLILRFHNSEPNWLASDPRGEFLATGGWDNQIAIFDLRDGRLVLNQPGTRIVAATDRSAFHTTNGATWRLIESEPPFARATIPVPEVEKGPRHLAFSHDGRRLATAGPSGVRLIDRRTLHVQRLLDQEPTVPVGFTADDRQLHAITRRRLLTWNLEGNPTLVQERARPPLADQESTVGAFSGDGARWIALEPHPVSRRLTWMLGGFDGAPPRAVEGFEPTGSVPQLSTDGLWLAWGNWQGRNAHARRLDGGGATIAFPVAGSASVTFTPDARHLMVSGPEDLRLYQVGTWRTVYTIPRRPPGGSAPKVAFTSDSRLGAVALTGRVLLFEAATGREVASLPVETHVLLYIAFSPDGRALAAAAHDHFVLLWDLETLRRSLRGLGLDWE